MDRYKKKFPELIEEFDFPLLEKSAHSVFALSTDLSLIYVNPAWFLFAENNGGIPAIPERFGLGTSVLQAMDPSLQEFYSNAFTRVLDTGEAWHHHYECSSPESFRLFHQKVFPLRNRRGLLVVNALIRSHLHHPAERVSVIPDETHYRQKTGLIVQCLNCRRVQHNEFPDRWDWVPYWVRQIPAETTGGMCPACFAHYWGRGVP